MVSGLWQDGVEVTSHLLSSMFAACAAAGSQEMLEAADGSHMHMEGLWNKICSKGKTASEEKYALQPCICRVCETDIATFGIAAFESMYHVSAPLFLVCTHIPCCCLYAYSLT